MTSSQNIDTLILLLLFEFSVSEKIEFSYWQICSFIIPSEFKGFQNYNLRSQNYSSVKHLRLFFNEWNINAFVAFKMISALFKSVICGND